MGYAASCFLLANAALQTQHGGGKTLLSRSAHAPQRLGVTRQV